MKVMMSLGGNTKRLINTTIAKQVDNIDCLYFPTVDEFIHQSNLRHLVFDRIVFTQKFISTDVDMKKLCDYVRQYLSSVEIVMIVNKSSSASYEYLFKKYFDSPLYTLMYIDRVTARNMLDSVQLPIVDVKARYYLLENKPKDTGISAVYDGNSAEISNNHENAEREKNDSDVPTSFEKVPSFDESFSSDSAVKSELKDIVTPISSGLDSESSSLGFSKNPEFPDEGSSLVGDEKNADGFSTFSVSDFDLSVGDFGSQHSDSGFVGDDDLDELEQFSASRASSNAVERGLSDMPVPQGEVVASSTPLIIDKEEQVLSKKPSLMKKPSEAPQTMRVSTLNDNSVSSNSSHVGKVNIVTGCSGSGASAYIAGIADKLSKEGKKVLVLDLDCDTNGILSFIDVAKFYEGGYYNGINDKKLYSEDNIDIMSNGYGMPKPQNIDMLLGDSVFKRYDAVFVDCPLEYLNLMSDNVFCRCNVIVCSITDVSKIIETSYKLSDRSIVSLKKEIYIANNCIVANKNIPAGSVSYVKNMCIFANGCWLDRL